MFQVHLKRMYILLLLDGVFCRCLLISWYIVLLCFKKYLFVWLQQILAVLWHAGSFIVVSLWLVIPMAAMSSALAPILESASEATEYWVSQISCASCSTQPECGKYCVNSFCATDLISPFLLNKIQFTESVSFSFYVCFFVIFFVFLNEILLVSLYESLFVFHHVSK